MTIARSLLVDVGVTPWYHVISKTVRGAFLLAEGEMDRKQWIEDRLQHLASLFCIEVAGVAVLDSHLHVLLKLQPEVAAQWSDEDVVRRWARLYPPRGMNRKPMKVTQDWIEQKLADKELVDKWRSRLSNLGWFMKCLKETVARFPSCHQESRHCLRRTVRRDFRLPRRSRKIRWIGTGLDIWWTMGLL